MSSEWRPGVRVWREQGPSYAPQGHPMLCWAPILRSHLIHMET